MPFTDQKSRDNRQERPRIGKPQPQGSQQNIKPGTLKPLSELRRERGDDWDPFGKRKEAGVFSKVVAFFRGENEHASSSNGKRTRSKSTSAGSKSVRRKPFSQILFEKLIEPFLQDTDEKGRPVERRYSSKSLRSKSAKSSKKGKMPERRYSQGSRHPNTTAVRESEKPKMPEVRARSSSLPRRVPLKGDLLHDAKKLPLRYNAAENKYEDLNLRMSDALRQDRVEVQNSSAAKRHSMHGAIDMVSGYGNSEGKDGREWGSTSRSRDADASRSSRHRQSKLPEMSERRNSRPLVASKPSASKDHSRSSIPEGYTYDEPSAYSQAGRTKSFYADDIGPSSSRSRAPLETVWNYDFAVDGVPHSETYGDRNISKVTDRSDWTYDWEAGENIFSNLPKPDYGSPLKGTFRARSDVPRDTLDRIYATYAESKLCLTDEIRNCDTVDEVAERKAELARLESMMYDFLDRIAYR